MAPDDSDGSRCLDALPFGGYVSHSMSISLTSTRGREPWGALNAC